jgi:hypothetical protein
VVSVTEVAQVAELLATAEPFRSWLVSDDLNRIVGTCEEPRECPIAEFLAHHGVQQPSVGSLDVEYFDVGSIWHQELMPVWARDFVKAVDVWLPRLRITADECLAVLDAALSHEPHPEAA